MNPQKKTGFQILLAVFPIVLIFFASLFIVSTGVANTGTGTTNESINAALSNDGGISGNVTDEAGQPLGSVEVNVYSGWSNVSTTYTDELGNFSVSGLPTYQYKLEFSRKGSISEYYDDKQGLGSANLVYVAAGSTTVGINAVLSTGGTISGQVTDETGQPLGSVHATAYRDDGTGRWSYVSDGYTDDLGKYSVTSLATGQYKLYFYKTSYCEEYYNDKPDLTSADLIDVTAGSTTPEINAALSTGGTISGQVNDENGQPLGSVYGEACKYEGYRCTYIYAFFTDDLGHYSVSGLRTGQYKLSFSKDGYIPEYYNDKPDLASADPIDMTEGSTTSGKDATLALCAGTAPDLRLSAGTPIWASFADYTRRRLSMPITISNPGGPSARYVALTNAINTGGVLLETWLPDWVGDVEAGESLTTTISYTIPTGVTTFRTTLFASAQDTCGTTYNYPRT